jgi:hypothetical protein
MEIVTPAILSQAIEIIGEIGISNEDIEARVSRLVSDAMTARRLIDFIPEAFGMVLLSHVGNGKVVMPTGFQARNKDEKWKSFPFSSEPIFVAAFTAAQTMFQNGPRVAFEAIANRSSTVQALNNALHQGANLDGATFSGPALIGIPAEVYPPVKEKLLNVLLDKCFSWRLKRLKKSRSA